MSEAVFLECLKSLSSGKAPGPDKIGNELLKMLPVQVKKLIHMLFTLMWVTGITPDAWKHSETCLIYKKGDPTYPGGQLQAHRPCQHSVQAMDTMDSSGDLCAL
jgi:hypothetical protein